MKNDFLLDTHAFLCLLSEPELVSPDVIEAMSERGSRRFLNVVSIWEICQKVRVEKLRLGMPVAAFFEKAFHDLLLQELPLRQHMIYEAVDLPLLHRDPFDRMLVCQARAEEMILVTKDQQVRQYDVATLW